MSKALLYVQRDSQITCNSEVTTRLPPECPFHPTGKPQLKDTYYNIPL